MVADGVNQCRNIRLSTLQEMEEAGLLETRSKGERYSDTHWHLNIRDATMGYFFRMESQDEIRRTIGPFRHHLRLSGSDLQTYDGKWVAYKTHNGGWILHDDLREPFDLNEPAHSIVMWAEKVQPDTVFVEAPNEINQS
jgi:hypothetical protein